MTYYGRKGMELMLPPDRALQDADRLRFVAGPSHELIGL
jgi:hypothetical protein